MIGSRTNSKERSRQNPYTAGRDLHSKLTNIIGQAKTFEIACQEAGVAAIDLPPFSQKTVTLPQLPNRGDLSPLKTAAFA